jgi:hypothetical protein
MDQKLFIRRLFRIRYSDWEFVTLLCQSNQLLCVCERERERVCVCVYGLTLYEAEPRSYLGHVSGEVFECEEERANGRGHIAVFGLKTVGEVSESFLKWCVRDEMIDALYHPLLHTPNHCLFHLLSTHHFILKETVDVNVRERQSPQCVKVFERRRCEGRPDDEFRQQFFGCAECEISREEDIGKIRFDSYAIDPLGQQDIHLRQSTISSLPSFAYCRRKRRERERGKEG